MMIVNRRVLRSGIRQRVISYGDLGQSATVQTIIPRKPWSRGVHLLHQLLEGILIPVTGMCDPGGFFAKHPVIMKRTRRYIVIHQTWGYDI
jgi:hypothetical protein